MPSSDSSPLPSPSRRGPVRSAVRTCERGCGALCRYFPLGVVYGLTTWAVLTEASLSIIWREQGATGTWALFGGIVLYLLLNWSYTACAFTDPGSPLKPPSTKPSSTAADGYARLPLHDPSSHLSETQSTSSSLTVKASGDMRFCKKCQTRKPDRAHHCSTCRRCVLKMDHHCPWLATCVGLHNYKPFILFCAYTTLFCYLCCAVATSFVWGSIVSGTDMGLVRPNSSGWLEVNAVMLAVLAGIIGLVLTGFTAWHLSLAVRNQTTIECLEKTRYVTPIRRNMQRLARTVGGRPAGLNGGDPNRLGDEESANLLQRYGQQLTEIHANALPGVTRPEEGEERASPAPASNDSPFGAAADSLRTNYASLERERERARYAAYLDEKDSETLPHAFDLGWRRNLRSVFGPRLWLSWLPIRNSLGDGWHWEPSPRWLQAREDLRIRREAEHAPQEAHVSLPQSTRHDTPASNGPHAAQGDWASQRHFVDVASPEPFADHHSADLNDDPAQHFSHPSNLVPGQSRQFNAATPMGGALQVNARKPGSEVSMHTLHPGWQDHPRKSAGQHNQHEYYHVD